MNVFLAAPFTSVWQEQTGLINSKFRKRLQRIIDLIAKKGHNVVSAHIRENWGENIMDPNKLTPLDVKLIKECDLVIAYINSQPSGVYIELGWASIFKKRVIILTEQPISQLSPLMQGMGQITETTIINFKSENELLKKLSSLL